MSGENGTAKVHSVETGDELFGGVSRVHTAVFSPDSRLLVTLGAERVARVWDLAKRRQILTLQGHLHLISTATFSPDGRFIATAGYDGMVKLWSAGTGREVIQASNWAWAPAFSPDGRRVKMCSWWDFPRVWDTQSGKEVLVLKSKIHSAMASSLFSPDGQTIFTSGNEKVARVWGCPHRASSR